jgi:mannosyltransferase OCH1-like enzyme
MMNKIPKIIHQTYYKSDLLPPEIINSIDKLKTLNPDWEYRFYDDAAVLDFIRVNYGDAMLNRIKKINPKYNVVMADLFRYLVLYKEGGLYLDIKSTAIKPLSQIIKPDDTFLISQWRNQLGFKFAGWGLFEDLIKIPGGEFHTWYIATVPNHPFLSNVINKVVLNIDHYTTERFGVGREGVLRVSGPIAYTLAIAPMMKNHRFRIIDAEASSLVYSIYKGNYDHDKLFKYKYSNLDAPIILHEKVQKKLKNNALASTAP